MSNNEHYLVYIVLNSRHQTKRFTTFSFTILHYCSRQLSSILVRDMMPAFRRTTHHEQQGAQPKNHATQYVRDR